MNGQCEPDAKQIVDEVRALIESAGGGGMTGSRLGLLLREKWPTFSATKLGVATLREFIGTQMKDIRELRKAGGDVVYALGSQSEDIEDQTETMDDLWRVWISPLSAFAIAVESNNGEVRRIVLGESTAGAVHIGPAPIEKHRAIAKDFLEARSKALNPDGRATLEGILSDPDPRWWERWNRTLGNISPQLAHNWFMFREAALSTALRKTLQEVGLSDEVVAKAFQTILTSRQRRASATRRTVERKSSEDSALPFPVREELVHLVQRVVSRLTVDELRAMLLPLGLVLDSLHEKHKD